MGNAFLYGNGGTAALNFRIIGGTTEPQNPRENDIWVNTDVPIHEWAFKSSIPEPTGNEGDVVIVYAPAKNTISPSMNLLKTNTILAKPSSAYQFDGSTWILKQTSVYDGSEWLPLKDYFYKDGTISPEIGGLSKSSTGIGNYTLAGDRIQIINPAQSYPESDFWLYTNQMIDVTNYSQIGIKAQVLTGPDVGLSFILSTKQAANGPAYATDVNGPWGPKELIVDVSNLTGYYYINLYAGSLDSTACNVDIFELWGA